MNQDAAKRAKELVWTNGLTIPDAPREAVVAVIRNAIDAAVAEAIFQEQERMVKWATNLRDEAVKVAEQRIDSISAMYQNAEQALKDRDTYWEGRIDLEVVRQYEHDKIQMTQQAEEIERLQTRAEVAESSMVARGEEIASLWLRTKNIADELEALLPSPPASRETT